MDTDRFSVVFYHTDDKLYTRKAERLTASLKEHNVPYKSKIIKGGKGWWAGCRYMPRFLKEMTNLPVEYLLYVDADTIFHAYPKLIDSFNADLGLRYDGARLWSGVMILRNCLEICDFLDKWIEESDKAEDYKGSDYSLQRVIAQNSSRWIVEKLPWNYDYIVREDEGMLFNTGLPAKTVIAHYPTGLYMHNDRKKAQ